MGTIEKKDVSRMEKPLLLGKGERRESTPP